MNASSIQFDRFDPEGTRAAMLPVVPDRPTYRAQYRTAEAVFQPGDGEIWVPMVERDEKGDFAGLLDAMVRALETERVRFLGVRHPEDPAELSRAWEILSPGDGRPIYEAVDGFDFERVTETWAFGESEPCMSLVGTWRVD